MELLLPLVLLALMWVLLVRPQQQRVRRQRELIASLEVGDEVVTAGGVVGQVVGLEEDEVRLEVARGVTMRFVRLAVSSRVEPTTETVEEPGPEALGGGDEE
jgi:preprotein translocase subunit YajC